MYFALVLGSIHIESKKIYSKYRCSSWHCLGDMLGKPLRLRGEMNANLKVFGNLNKF